MIKPKSTKLIRTSKIAYIIMSVMFCLFGLTVCLFDLNIPVIGTVSGILLAAFGCIKLMGYFSKDLFRLAFQFDLAFGILLIALSAIVLFHSDKTMNFICVVLGIGILTDALFKAQTSMDARSFGLRFWWMILMIAVLTVIFGMLLIFQPFPGTHAMRILLGLSLLTEGILSLCTVLTAVKIVRNQMPDEPYGRNVPAEDG